MKSAHAIRLAAALIAVSATLGLAVQFVASLRQLSSPLATLWVLVWYFTILTNMLVAAVFFLIALAGLERFPVYLLAGTTLSIVLVGAIYFLLLHGLTELSGGSQVANTLLHLVTPVAVPLFWLLIAVKGKLRWRDPLLWALYPLAYFFYALVRGHFTHAYPYPFIDVAQLGWPRTLVNACVIAAAYLASGYLMVTFDRRLSATSGSA